MFARAVPIIRVRGVEVKLDPSLALIVVLVGWTLSLRFAADHAMPVAIGMAAAGTLLFFASLLAHEAAHAAEALHRDLEVHSITLFLFGGVTEMHATSRTPRDEFVVAAVGPYVSLVCGAVFGLIATFATAGLGTAGRPIADVAGLLAWLNVLLAVFNLIPGAPLDGGRVLRAGLWWLTGDRRRALRIAARAGQVLGVLVAGYGIAGLVLAGRAALAGAAWWIVIGAFLWAAARGELRQDDLDHLLGSNTVGDVVGTPGPTLAAIQRLDAADLPRGRTDLLGVVDGARFVGVIPAEELDELHPADRALRLAGEIAEPVDDRPGVAHDGDLHALVDAFRSGADVVRIERGGTTVGAVTERDVARAINRLRARGRTEPYGPPPSGAPLGGHR